MFIAIEPPKWWDIIHPFFCMNRFWSFILYAILSIELASSQLSSLRSKIPQRKLQIESSMNTKLEMKRAALNVHERSSSTLWIILKKFFQIRIKSLKFREWQFKDYPPIRAQVSLILGYLENHLTILKLWLVQNKYSSISPGCWTLKISDLESGNWIQLSIEVDHKIGKKWFLLLPSESSIWY